MQNRRLGLGLWILFCLVMVVIRGVRWDETYEYAQVIAGEVAYPDGHPLNVYAHNAFSIQPYFSAALLKFGAGPAVVCGFRNLLFLLASVVPVYLLGSHLANSALAGHAAAALTLRGVYLEFDGSYPLAVWPHTFSNGHIGGGMALLALALMVSGRLRSGFFLAGLMPAVHVGQWPVILAVTLLIAWREWGRSRDEARKALASFALGIACVLGFWLIIQTGGVPIAESGAYAPAETGDAIWRSYIARFDPHRAMPPGNGHVVLAGMVLLGFLAWMSEIHRDRRAAIYWVWVYGVVAAFTAWFIMALHWLLGENIPFLLIGWMPYRLINHVPPLLLCVMIASLVTHQTNRPWMHPALVAVLGFAAVYPFLRSVVTDPIYNRFLIHGEAVYFGLMGATAAVASAHLRVPSRIRDAVLILFLTCFAALVVHHQFGAGSIAVAFVGALLLHGYFKDLALRNTDVSSLTAVAAIAVAVVILTVSHEEGVNRSQLPRSEFNTQVAASLRAFDNAERIQEPVTMIAAEPFVYLLQAQTGAPVFVDNATSSFMTYMPRLAPVIQSMYADFYGIRFDIPANDRPPWRAVWDQRSQSEWVRLGERYEIGYVIASGGLSLDLPVVLTVRGRSLYRIPNPN